RGGHPPVDETVVAYLRFAVEVRQQFDDELHHNVNTHTVLDSELHERRVADDRGENPAQGEIAAEGVPEQGRVLLQATAHHRLRIAGVGGDHLGGQPSGFERIVDALPVERVDHPPGVADEQQPAVE